MDFLNGWVLFGFLGQAAFSARFIVQWIVSEKNKVSTIPIAFWYLSLLGGLILCIYAFYKKDPVFFIGQGSGLVVYIRNLVLIKKKQQAQALNKCR
jgi:lipid-A-disaccharide synthase-like uncharacterized protein